VNDITGDDTTQFDWAAVAEAAPNARLAFTNPARTVGGLAVLLSGAGDYHDVTSLTGTEVNDSGFYDWITPVVEAVPNFNTLGASVADTLAARGSSIGQIGLLPESEWLRNLRGSLTQENDPVVLSYPEYTVVFDFPVALWQDTTLPANADEAAAVEALGRWLLTAAQQSSAEDFGLRPAQGDPASEQFKEGARYGALISPVLQTVEPPSRNDLRQFVEWVSTIVR
jgi:ABC-type sulfate transport system substrate-binding protein